METETDMETVMETVMETDMETERDVETEIDMEMEYKLFLLRRNSPHSAVRIVANMSTAQFPMALCTCNAYLL
jgi:hypothetical protein